MRCISCVRTTLVKKCTFAQSDLVRKHAINFSCCETKISRARQSPCMRPWSFTWIAISFVGSSALFWVVLTVSATSTVMWYYYQSLILAFWARIFFNESPFFMKNQPCDTIINPKFWVQFSGFLAFKSNIFTIFESSNIRKNAMFLTKNQPCDTIINPRFWVQFLAFWARLFWIMKKWPSFKKFELRKLKIGPKIWDW